MFTVRIVTPVLIDVLNAASNADAVNKVKEQVDGLDEIVNVIGIMVIGAGIELEANFVRAGNNSGVKVRFRQIKLSIQFLQNRSH